MLTAQFRQVGGSVMLAIPRSLLESIGLSVGSTVQVAIESGGLRIEPMARPSYKLDDLLAQCDSNEPISDEDREWLDDAPRGNEIV